MDFYSYTWKNYLKATGGLCDLSLDDTHTDRMAVYANELLDVNKKLNGKALAMQIAVGEAEDFRGIIDVLTEKMATFDNERGAVVEWSDVPAEYLPLCELFLVRGQASWTNDAGDRDLPLCV